MERWTRRLARAWLPFLLPGVLSVALGPLLPGGPPGLGPVFIGLACIAFGVTGVAWPGRYDSGLNLPAAITLSVMPLRRSDSLLVPAYRRPALGVELV